MPASPACSERSRASNWRRGSFLGAIRYWMLGRSKLATKWRASVEIQARGDLGLRGLVAVAVRAMRGTAGQRSCSSESIR